MYFNIMEIIFNILHLGNDIRTRWTIPLVALLAMQTARIGPKILKNCKNRQNFSQPQRCFILFYVFLMFPFFRKNNMVKTNLVPQFSTKKALFGLFRKRE